MKKGNKAKGKGMVCAVGVLVLHIHGCRSLKEKRSILKRFVSGLKKDFNAALAEVASQDMYQRAEIGFSLVGNAVDHVNAMADQLINKAEAFGGAELVDADFEILNYSEF